MNKYYILFIILLMILNSSCSQTGIELVPDGHSDYRIVIAKDASEYDRMAGNELQKYVKAITGVSIPIVHDDVPYRSKEIILGSNRHLSHVKLAIQLDDVERDAICIQTVGKDLVLLGTAQTGALYAVYSFLENYLDCRMYTPDAISIPKKQTVRLPRIQDKHIPVFTYRETLHYFPLTSEQYCYWHKLHSRKDRQSEWGMWVHTFDDLIPIDKYYQEHPEYFSEIAGQRIKGGQLCMSNTEMYNVLVENLRQKMAQRPDAQIWSVSQNDNVSFCTCDKCKATDEKYGAHSGSVLEFVNKVAREFPDKIISTLAYQYSRKAPKGIKPEKNVNIMFCSIECNRSKPLESDPGEAAFRQDLIDWGKLTDNILVWDYVVQFRNFLNPFPNLHVLQPNLQFFARNNCKLMFQQGSNQNVTEFHEFRTYLIAKLLWDPDINIDKTMNDFLNGYYGAAGPFIREYIDLMHNNLKKSGARLDIYGYPYDGIKSYLTPALIKRYESIFDQAEEAVQNNPTILKRVRRARLPVEFAILDISLHSVDDNLTYLRILDGKLEPKEDMLTRVEHFVRLCEENNIGRLEEHGYAPVEFRKNVYHIVDKAQGENLALGKPVTIETEWSEKYPVGGPKALTDGLYGTLDYHYNWLGFEYQHLKMVLDLGKSMDLKEIKADFMRLHTAWIFLPRTVEFAVSIDGITFKKVGTVRYETKRAEGDIYLKEYGVTLENTHARYVRLFAESIRTCPDWHPGAGGKAWIFTDEIMIN